MNNWQQIHYIGRLFLFVLLANIVSSCKEEIDIELNSPKTERIVVEGRILNQYQNQTVRFTKTLSYFANEKAPALLELDAFILEEGSSIRYDLTLVDSLDGIYQTQPFRGKSGETYSLNLLYENDTYRATTYLDTVAQMDSINYEYEFFSYPKPGNGYYKIRMSAQEPETKGNIYMFYIYLNDSLLNNQVTESIFQNDDFFNGQYVANVEIYYLPQEEIIRDTNHVKVAMLSISKDEFNFINIFFSEVFANNSIFNGPPANIPSNLKNLTGGEEGLGFFGASSITTGEMMLYKQHNESTNNPYYKP